MLKGKNVGLRAISRGDLEQLLQWRNQPKYRVYFREYRELSMENQVQWFENTVLNDEHTRMFAVQRIDTGVLIGACGLCYIDWINRCADFSIYIGKDEVYIDDVYAIDAAEVLMDYGFGELNLHRLWSEIYEIDNAKKRMFDRLGFVHEATHKKTHWTEGSWVDSWYYRITEDEYLDWKKTGMTKIRDMDNNDDRSIAEPS